MATLITYATLDHKALDAGIVQANAKVGGLAKNIQAQGANLEQQLGMQLKRAALRLAAYGTIFAGVGLAKEIIKVRGEFQQLGIAFETMLGSKAKADKMMAESIGLCSKDTFRYDGSWQGLSIISVSDNPSFIL